MLVALLKGAARLIKIDGEGVLKWQAMADTRELALFTSLGCESALSQTLITSMRIKRFNLQHGFELWLPSASTAMFAEVLAARVLLPLHRT